MVATKQKTLALFMAIVLLLGVFFVNSEKISAAEAGCGGIVYREPGPCENGIEVFGFECYSDICGNVSAPIWCIYQLCA